MTKPSEARYPFGEFEPAWQSRWEAADLFRADRDEGRPKWFIMELPPFANGSLHLGHVRNYALADSDARFRRMLGYNVMYTTGFDSFGLPNENSAREEGCHPADLSERCMADMRRQFVRLGLGHDTRRIDGTHEPRFYRWVQWVFLEFFRAGLAYRRRAKVNWCPGCGIVLADSLVEGGRCWRCTRPIEARLADQWFIREDEFAESMLDGLASLDGWPPTVKRIQADWIGRREGTEIKFAVVGHDDLIVSAFLEDVTLLTAVEYVGLGLGHPLLTVLTRRGLLTADRLSVLAAMERSEPATREARKQSYASSEAILLGVAVRHPLGGEPLPLIVLEALEFREGTLAGCPSRVRSDRNAVEGLGFEETAAPPPPADDAGDRDSILRAIAESGLGGPAVRYRLRDWCVARQRYWGTPVPIIHCESCGPVAVPDRDLPVLLPYDVDLMAPGNPLERHAEFLAASCPECGRPARRDPDTLETYSSPWWYHWTCRSLDRDTPFDPDDVSYWMPVDLMVGGIDQTRTCFFHTRMTARFLTRRGLSRHDEPVRHLIAIGMVKHDGAKMSKSAGNSVDPGELIAAFGADALRVGILGAAAPTSDMNWMDGCVRRAHSFLGSVWRLLASYRDSVTFRGVKACRPAIDAATPLRRRLDSWLGTACERITRNYADVDTHLAVKNLMFLFERIAQFERTASGSANGLTEEDLSALSTALCAFVRMLAPVAPHISEELWKRHGGEGFVAVAPWPGPDVAAREAQAHPA